MADGQSKSFFYPFSGVTDELKTFLSDVSTANLKVKLPEDLISLLFSNLQIISRIDFCLAKGTYILGIIHTLTFSTGK